MRSMAIALMAAALALHASAFDCALTAAGIQYDLKPLGGLRTATHTSSTPPTSNEAKVLMNLCGGIGSEDGVSDEDKCPSDSHVCLKVLNHKSSSSDPDRVTAVVPIWPNSLGDDKIWTTPIGQSGEGGLKIYVEGNEYAGLKQHLNLTLVCSQGGQEQNPTLHTYTPGTLSMEWASPDACPRDGSGSGSGGGSSDDGSDGQGGGSGSGWGFWGFIKFLFWCGVLGLALYFGIGMFYNHQQYSARGWDLVPHRDFWRELPTLGSDLVHHVSTNVRGGGSRGGYNSLG